MKLIYLITFLLMSGCSSGNLEYVKDRANSKFQEIGFTVVGYEKLNPNGTPNGISYNGYIQRWGKELHVYGPSATDAIKP